MRLGTLARKISITPSKLTAFLESQDIELLSGTNTKLTEEQIDLILEHYQVTLETETIQEEETIQETAVNEEVVHEEVPVPEVETTAEPIAEEINEEIQAEKTVDKQEIQEEEESPTSKISESFAEIALPHELDELSDTIETDEPTVQTEVDSEEKEETEEEYVPQIPEDLDPEIESYVERLAYDENIKVIKPAKVKLQGLTVKGKIDLPEPKVTTETVDEPKEEKPKTFDPDEIITTTGPKRDRKRKPKNYKGKKFDKGYNPLEAARKKKEWEEKKRKEREENRKKKAKAKHYKKVVKPVAAAAPKKKTKKVTEKKKQQQQQPTGNMLQRFWRWMNT